jgi:hypothetical protein
MLVAANNVCAAGSVGNSRDLKICWDVGRHVCLDMGKTSGAVSTLTMIVGARSSNGLAKYLIAFPWASIAPIFELLGRRC